MMPVRRPRSSSDMRTPHTRMLHCPLLQKPGRCTEFTLPLVSANLGRAHCSSCLDQKGRLYKKTRNLLKRKFKVYFNIYFSADDS